MTETTEDRTKRTYITKLLSYTWQHQTSVFYECHESSLALLDKLPSIKAKLRRKYPDQPFLLRVQLKEHKDCKEWRAYLVVFSLSKVEGLWQYLNSITSGNAYNMKLPEWRRLRAAKAISDNPPHELKSFFGRDKINRQALLNEKHLPAADDELLTKFYKSSK